MVNKIHTLVLLLCISSVLVLSQEFDAFKSYKDAKKKPPQYSDKIKTHDIDEYLTKQQLEMKNFRDGKDSNTRFDGKFSGFDQGWSVKRLRGSRVMKEESN